MIVIDTTVLVYAVGSDHPLREPCQRLVEAIGAGRLEATTTVEVIQEFAHVRARRRGRRDAQRLALAWVDLLSPLLQPGEEDLRSGLELFVAHRGLGPFDAVLVATAVRAGHVEALVSADRALAAIPGIRHVDPADSGALDRLLAGGS